MPWQGQCDNLIDRFDVRAHLDYIPPVTKASDTEEVTNDERQCNYERYRILAQNDFLGEFELASRSNHMTDFDGVFSRRNK